MGEILYYTWILNYFLTKLNYRTDGDDPIKRESIESNPIIAIKCAGSPNIYTHKLNYLKDGDHPVRVTIELNADSTDLVKLMKACFARQIKAND